MFGKSPPRLPKYFEEFAPNNDFKNSTNVFDGPAIGVCAGVSGRCHTFLVQEGHGNCFKCNVVVCRSCRQNIEKQVFCLDCYASRAILPQSLSSAISIAEMRLELKSKYNFDGVGDIDITEVEDVYESIGYVDRYNEQGKHVQFPIYPTHEIDSNAPTGWKSIIEIDFKAKGSFLADPLLTEHHIPAVLTMFGSLVKFNSNNEKKTNWISEKSIHNTLPALFFYYSGGCRVDSGYRLLKRCLRHTVDSKF